MLNYVCQPFCRHCDDFHYLRDRDGNPYPCPACSCPTCLRLKFQHPDLGGCVCEAKQRDETPYRLRPLTKGNHLMDPIIPRVSKPATNAYSVIATAFMQVADELRIPIVEYRTMRNRAERELGIGASLDAYKAVFTKYHAEKGIN